MQTKSKAVPKLRFKEFSDNWKVMRLEDITEKIQDGTHFSPIQMEKGNYKYLTSKNIRNGFMDLNDVAFLSDEAHREIYQRCDVKFNDILLTKDGASTGAVCLNELNEEFSLLSSVAFLRANKALAVNGFLYQIMAGPKGQQEIQASIAGQAITRITLSKIRNYKFFFPTLPEQQKIASFLSAIDEKIQQLTRKKELLEQYKKGVMQQLFAGKLRFKNENGKAYPKWEMVGGDKLFDCISDKKHNSDLPILAITQEQGAIPRDMINYQMSVTESSIASYKVVQEGDFIISLRTFQGGIEYSKYKGICSPAYNILRPNSPNVDRNFYRYYLKTSRYIMQLQKNLEGIRDGKMISYKYFAEIKLPFPSREEQQKIANFLSGIDTKIESVANQITQTQMFKKGLLQQMFV